MEESFAGDLDSSFWGPPPQLRARHSKPSVSFAHLMALGVFVALY